MDARVRSVVFLALLWGGAASGDWMLHTPGGGPIEDRCPCLPVALCPRPFGLSPHDVLQFGHLPVCMDASYVRCCGASFSVKISPVLRIPNKISHQSVDLHIKLDSGLDGVDLYDSSAGDIIDERQNPQELKRASEKITDEPFTPLSSGQERNETEDKTSIVQSAESNGTIVEGTVADDDNSTAGDEYSDDSDEMDNTSGNNSFVEYQDDSEETTEVVDTRNNTDKEAPSARPTEDLTTAVSVETNGTNDNGDSNNNVTASGDHSIPPERLSVSISISFSTSKSNRNDSSFEDDETLYPKANATCEEIQNLIEHLKSLKQEEWKDKVLGHVRESSSKNFSSEDRTGEDVVLVYPVNGHRRSNDKADIDVSIVYPMNSICAQMGQETGEMKASPEDVINNSSATSNTSQVLGPSLEKSYENDTAEALKATAALPSLVNNSLSPDILETPFAITQDDFSPTTEINGLPNSPQTKNEPEEIAGFNGVDAVSELGVNSTDSDLYDSGKRENVTNAEESNVITTDEPKRNTTQDILQSRRMLFGQRLRQKPAQKVLNTTQASVQRNRTRLVDLYSKYSRQSPLGRSSRFQSGNAKANVTWTRTVTSEEVPQNIDLETLRTESQPFDVESGNGPEKTVGESRSDRFFTSQQNENPQPINNISSEDVTNPNTTSIEHRNVSGAEISSHETTVSAEAEKLLPPDQEIEEEIVNVGSKINHKQTSRSVTIQRDRGRKYNHFLRNYKREERKEIENGRLSIMNGENKNSSVQNVTLLQIETDVSSENIHNGNKNDSKTSSKESCIQNERTVDLRKTLRSVPSDRESRIQRGRKVLRLIPSSAVADVEVLLNKTSGTTENVSPLESSSTHSSPRGTKSSERNNSGGQRLVRVVKRLRGKSGKLRNNDSDGSPNTVKINQQNSTRSEIFSDVSGNGKDKSRAHPENNRTWTSRGVEMYRLSKTRLFFPVRSTLKKDETVGVPKLPPEHNSKTLADSIAQETWDPMAAVLRDGRETFKTPSTMETGFLPMESSRNEDAEWEKRKKIAEMELQNPLVFQLPEGLEDERQNLVSTLTALGQDVESVNTDIQATNVPSRGSTTTYQNHVENQETSAGSANGKDVLKSNNAHQHNQLFYDPKENRQRGLTTKQSVFQKPTSVDLLHDDKGKLVNDLKQLEDAVQDVWKLQQLQQSRSPSVKAPEAQYHQSQNWSQQWLEGFPKAQQLHPDGPSHRPRDNFRPSPPDLTQTDPQERPPASTHPDQRLPQQGLVFREADEDEQQLITRMQQMLPPPIPFYRDSPSQFPREFNPVPQVHPDPHEQYYQQLQKYHQQQVQYYQRLRQFLSLLAGLNKTTR